MLSITDAVLHGWRAMRQTKHTPSGWYSGNAVCCDDTRNRGGVVVTDGALTYHCFHCQFKCSWQPGRPLSKNIRKLMSWLNISDEDIAKYNIEALKLMDEADNAFVATPTAPTFRNTALPDGAKPIIDYIDNPPKNLLPILEYLHSRHLFLSDYNFHWSPKLGMDNRLIIPFYSNNILVGYTARDVMGIGHRYMSDQQPGFVFNTDAQRQHPNRKYVIVCEGPVDAISIQGCALMGASIKPPQDLQLKQLNKEIIFVPDRDAPGIKPIPAAIEFGWSVSMPDWPDGIKDINDAVVKLGRLKTLWMILAARSSYALKIELTSKLWVVNDYENTER